MDGLHIAAAVVTVLGATAFGVDIGNRMLGSSWRYRIGRPACIGLIVVSSVLWLTPVAVSFVLPAPRVAMVSGALGVLAAWHYVFPLRFGVRRERRAIKAQSVKPLAGPVKLREVTVEVPGLPPAADGLSLLVVSDVHCNTTAQVERIRDCAAALRAVPGVDVDLVCICGDLGETVDLLPDTVDALAGLPNRLGAFCVRGNHDFEGGRGDVLREVLAGSPIQLLENDSRLLDGGNLVIAGIENPWRGAALPDLPDGAFHVGLMHTPDAIGLVRRGGVDFAVCGHTHGGRMRLPLVGSPCVPVGRGRFLDVGLFRAGATWLYIGGGVGGFGEDIPAQGEMVLVRLQRGVEG